uniref:Uncharacterized protein n=1 Tax=Meloidogyne enterolobii TaxID=390850 RepID=A0A6V7Y678_MELEN|nr:unnamed protein product [Meloidogyne enterolobii]
MASQNFENQGTSKGKLSSSALHLLKNYDKLVELREQGKTFKEIGQMFGVKRDTVQYIVRKKENKCQSRYPKLPILSDSSEDEMDYDDTIQKVDLVNNIENRQFRTLQSRFYCQAVQRYYAGPITPKIHLTRLFRLSFHQSKENISQSRFVYKCIDCSFSVRKMYFIPIVYLIIDHFLDCKEHLVIENIRKVFLEEREAFKAFLGIHFNHFYKLPKEAELTFHPKNSGSFYRCSLKIPENLIIEAEDESNLTEHDEMEGDNSDNSDDTLENIY